MFLIIVEQESRYTHIRILLSKVAERWSRRKQFQCSSFDCLLYECRSLIKSFTCLNCENGKLSPIHAIYPGACLSTNEYSSRIPANEVPGAGEVRIARTVRLVKPPVRTEIEKCSPGQSEAR